jgi:hypothetical protein
VKVAFWKRDRDFFNQDRDYNRDIVTIIIKCQIMIAVTLPEANFRCNDKPLGPNLAFNFSTDVNFSIKTLKYKSESILLLL